MTSGCFLTIGIYLFSFEEDLAFSDGVEVDGFGRDICDIRMESIYMLETRKLLKMMLQVDIVIVNSSDNINENRGRIDHKTNRNR